MAKAKKTEKIVKEETVERVSEPEDKPVEEETTVITEETEVVKEKATVAPAPSFEDFEQTLADLNTQIAETLNVAGTEKEVQAMLEDLKEKEQALLETIRALEQTKETLKAEITVREESEEELQQAMWGLNEEKTRVENDIFKHEKDIDAVRGEKDHLNQLASNLGVTLSTLKDQFAEFQNS